MSAETIQTMVFGLSLITLVTVLLLWRHIDKRAADVRNFELRLAKVEAEQKAVITPIEVRQIFEQLADVKGRMSTVTTLMHAIQEHLVNLEQKK